MKRQLALVWSNSRQPLRRLTGCDPMQPAILAYERQGALLAQRHERVVWLTDRQLWWFYYSD